MGWHFHNSAPDDRLIMALTGVFCGIVILIGGRFAEPGVFDLLPDDFVRGDPEELVTDDLPGTLRAFWEG